MKQKQPFLHQNKEHSYLSSMILSLIPLLCYGIYKNGFLPFWKKDAPILNIFTPILFFAVGFLIGGLVDYFHCLRKKEKVKWSNTPFYALIISMTMPIQGNLISYAIILFLGLTILKYFEEKLKKISISPLLFMQTLLLLWILYTKIPFENISEQKEIYFYTTLDLFFGRNIGGIASTSIFWMILIFLFLWFNDYYKKEIPIILLITYTICALLSELFFPTGDVLKWLLNPVIFFSSIFFASDISSSPYTQYGKWVYAILLGIIGWISYRFFHVKEGIYFGITILSLFVPLMDSLFYSIEKKMGSFVDFQKSKKEISKTNCKKELDLPKKISEK